LVDFCSFFQGYLKNDYFYSKLVFIIYFKNIYGGFWTDCRWGAFKTDYNR
jgi:hypothetical protein